MGHSGPSFSPSRSVRFEDGAGSRARGDVLAAAMKLLPLPPSPLESCTYLSIGAESTVSSDDLASISRAKGDLEGIQAAQFHREFPISARVLIGGGSGMPADMCIDANIESLSSCANRDTLWTLLDAISLGTDSSIEDGDKYEVQLRSVGVGRDIHRSRGGTLSPSDAAPADDHDDISNAVSSVEESTTNTEQPKARYRDPCKSAPAYYPNVTQSLKRAGRPGMQITMRIGVIAAVCNEEPQILGRDTKLLMARSAMLAAVVAEDRLPGASDVGMLQVDLASGAGLILQPEGRVLPQR